jgi:hypothetical protein
MAKNHCSEYLVTFFLQYPNGMFIRSTSSDIRISVPMEGNGLSGEPVASKLSFFPETIPAVDGMLKKQYYFK